MPENTKLVSQLNDLSHLNAMLFDTQTANIAKIQLIKEEIASNRYQINSRNIAGKLLEHAPLAEELETA
jgi:anti-sigma28 factor (negative regulator of flagellin synthesis)